MSKTALSGKVITKHHCIEDGLVVVEDKKIVFVGSKLDYREDDIFTNYISYPDSLIVPGMIDIHVHGNANLDVMDGKINSLRGIAKSLCSFGVTSFLATTMTMPISTIMTALENILAYQKREEPYAQLIGVHLEGPFISSKQKGAQKEEDILDPSEANLRPILDLVKEQLRVVTLAPEIPYALEAIQQLTEQGIICSIGHTNATIEEANQGLDAGANHFTHLFNAMRGLHHREPGVVGSALSNSEASCDVIADMIHVHPSAVKIAYDQKTREKLLLISDGMRAVGMGDGTFDLGGQTVHVHRCIARLDDGTLAGSTLTLNKAVQNLVQTIGIPLVDAIYMVSTAPAKKLGIDTTKGSLEIGKDADIVVLSKDFDAQLTMIQGQLAYQEGTSN
jgi:N-acetylglucosamine-6-phosphate deacetylase